MILDTYRIGKDQVNVSVSQGSLNLPTWNFDNETCITTRVIACGMDMILLEVEVPFKGKVEVSYEIIVDRLAPNANQLDKSVETFLMNAGLKDKSDAQVVDLISAFITEVHEGALKQLRTANSLSFLFVYCFLIFDIYNSLKYLCSLGIPAVPEREALERVVQLHQTAH